MKKLREVQSPGPGVFEQVARFDEAVYARLAQNDSKVLDVTMPALSRAADFSMLWIAIAGGMRLFGGRRTKRAAARSLGTLAVSSLITNQVLKRMHWRNRPDNSLVPARRVAQRMPTSSSFPSGHSASAAAFATSVALENLPLGAAIAPLATGVGVSRVATGAHYPSDVLTGFAVGTGVAFLGRKLVPSVAPVVTEDLKPDQHRVAPLPTGSGLRIIINAGSGPDDSAELLDLVREELPDAEIIEFGEGDDLVELANRTAEGATALGAAGGDGTIVAVAAAALEHDLPLAVFPAGTFNHFSKDARILDYREAIEAVQDGFATKVDVAELNDRIFLNTASIGAYPEFVTERERMEPKIGKRAAAVAAAWKLMKENPRVRLRVNGEELYSMLFFVGNGEYLPHDFAPAMRPSLADGKLDVRILRDRRFTRSRLLWAVLTGTVESSPVYVRIVADRVEVDVLQGEDVQVSRDGEVDPPENHITFAIRPAALTAYQPEDPGI